RFDGFRQGELLAEKATHETASAHFAAIFEATEGDQQLAPFRKVGFACQHLTKDHSVTPQQHLASGFESFVAVGGLDSIEQRPVECRGRISLGAPGTVLRSGLISARKFWKPSAVTSPAATSSQRAVSTSAFSLPVARTISAKNEAPRWRRKSATTRAFSVTRSSAATSSGLRGRIQSESSRTKNVIGATLVGTTLRFPLPTSSSVAGRGDMRP